MSYKYQVKESGNNIDDLQTIAHQIALSKGWWEEGERSLTKILCLLHFEISELWQARMKYLETAEYPSDKHVPECLNEVVEIADFMIRVFDFMEWNNVKVSELASAFSKTSESFNITNFHSIQSRFKVSSYLDQSFVFIGCIHNYISKCLEFDRGRDPVSSDRCEIWENLTRAVVTCISYCKNQYGDGVLEKALIGKMAANNKRPTKHGKRY